MSDKDFENLFRNAQNGDLKSLEMIITMFMPCIHKNSYINGVLDDDCLQELTLKLISCISRFIFTVNKDIPQQLVIS